MQEELYRLNDAQNSGPACAPDAAGHCITCSDEARPAAVLHLDPAAQTARVIIDGQAAEVDISLLDAVAPGDTLLVHGGVALFNHGQSHPAAEVPASNGGRS